MIGCELSPFLIPEIELLLHNLVDYFKNIYVFIDKIYAWWKMPFLCEFLAIFELFVECRWIFYDAVFKVIVLWTIC